jgi:hypothetical protein
MFSERLVVQDCGVTVMGSEPFVMVCLIFLGVQREQCEWG